MSRYMPSKSKATSSGRPDMQNNDFGSSDSERAPLLWAGPRGKNRDVGDDVHSQFCALVGCPPTDNANVNAPKHPKTNPKSLYGRATRGYRSQNWTYMSTAALSNTLLLSQVVLGAALTALGASASSHILITIFGAMNTIIAGLVAYLKSRGQPMRARMYRDDLERVVDEIENSEIMWLGISQRVHGYDDIDTDRAVTVRSEVARLTRLYDRAVKNNTMNNPDMYMAGSGGDGGSSGLRTSAPKPAPAPQPAPPLPAVAPAPVPPGGPDSSSAPPAHAPPAAPTDPDESPATAPKPQGPASAPPPRPGEKKDTPTPTPAPAADSAAKDGAEKKDGEPSSGSTGASSSAPPAPTPAPAPAPAPAPTPAPPAPEDDPDESPASKANIARRQPAKKVEGDAEEN